MNRGVMPRSVPYPGGENRRSNLGFGRRRTSMPNPARTSKASTKLTGGRESSALPCAVEPEDAPMFGTGAKGKSGFVGTRVGANGASVRDQVEAGVSRKPVARAAGRATPKFAFAGLFDAIEALRDAWGPSPSGLGASAEEEGASEAGEKVRTGLDGFEVPPGGGTVERTPGRTGGVDVDEGIDAPGVVTVESIRPVVSETPLASVPPISPPTVPTTLETGGRVSFVA